MKKGVTKKAATKKALPKKSAVKKGAKTPATTNKLLEKKPSSKKATKKRKPGKSKDEEGGCLQAQPPASIPSKIITIQTIDPGIDLSYATPARVDIGIYDKKTKQITVTSSPTTNPLYDFGFQVSSEPVGGPVVYYQFDLVYDPNTPATGFLRINSTTAPVAANLRVTILTKKKVRI